MINIVELIVLLHQLEQQDGTIDLTELLCDLIKIAEDF